MNDSEYIIKLDARVKLYIDITGFIPSPFQQELIMADVTDMEQWKEAIIFWMGNAYRSQSVLKVIEYYKEIGRQAQLSVPKGTYVGKSDEDWTEEELENICKDESERFVTGYEN